MKKLTCEMCGSTELLKQDGVFVCQNCGTKYSLEEAKKMMIEGTVDVSGSTVKIDDTAKIDNYLILAENAYDANNQKETENYCNKIIEIDSKNYKAWFLKGKTVGWQSTLSELRIEESANAFQNAIDNCPSEEKENIVKSAKMETEKLLLAIMKLYCKKFETAILRENTNDIIKWELCAVTLFSKFEENVEELKNKLILMMDNVAINTWNKLYSSYKNEKKDKDSLNLWSQLILKGNEIKFLIKYIISLCDENDNKNIIRYKKLIEISEARGNSINEVRAYEETIEPSGILLKANSETKKKRIDEIMEWHKKIKEIDSSYQIPERPRETTGGCYVATCVYGSYDCPEVWTLRRFRDYKLAKTWYGRTFIHTYYAISPSIVKYFGDTTWFKKMWKGKLDKMVAKLQIEGFENTPYEDKEW